MPTQQKYVKRRALRSKEQRQVGTKEGRPVYKDFFPLVGPLKAWARKAAADGDKQAAEWLRNKS